MYSNFTKNEKIDFINYEMTVNLCGKQAKVFLQRGFFNHNVPLKDYPSPYSFPTLHLHNYPEIHLFMGEGINLTVGGESFVPEPGRVLMVPGGVYHSLDIPSSALHCAFQIDIPATKMKFISLPMELLTKFIKEIQHASATSNYARLEKYISFIGSHFIETSPVKVKKTDDYAFVILEFMSLYYNLDIHLSDLAQRLHVSEKQTARLVLKYTGKTFNEELTRYRISAAEQLMMMNPDMPIGKIASLVGYQSHSGFWKAYKRYKGEKSSSE